MDLTLVKEVRETTDSAEANKLIESGEWVHLSTITGREADGTAYTLIALGRIK